MFVLYILIYLIRRELKMLKLKLKKSKPSISIKVILTFLKLILTLNNFVFSCINYLQKKGCAMHTKYAPSYTNIFMDWFEEKFLFPLLTNLDNFYLRFIDDIFLVLKLNLMTFLKKSVNVILASNLNMKFLKQKSIFSTPQCLK